MRDAKLAGAYIDPGAGRVTFRQYAEQWRQAQVHRETTALSVETYLRRHAYPFFGDRPVLAIRSSELQAWIKGRSDLLAPDTVRTVHQVVGTVFKAAVADRVITSSPAVGLKLPRVDRVDFLRRTIRVDRQMVTLAGRAPFLAPTKTDSSGSAPSRCRRRS